ncbi:MAG TPA: zinc finger Ran-binding domain-containing protein [Gemmatimonadaceae bacterium]|nr:zinc finger Ran-binding domain-containing protein [Gemmatimonadaceae bacterium]
MKDENPRDDAGSGGSSAGDDWAVANVGALMEERRRYELWLAALNARRAETPKHVFSRVHADYTSRLEAVIKRLTGQVEELRTELTTLATRIATLQEQQHRARDERAEAELRAHVGEMSAAEWERAAAASDAAIADLVRQKAAAEDALVRTRDFLADAERPATPAQAAAPVTSRPSIQTTAQREAPFAPRAFVDAPQQAPRGTTNVPVQGSPSGQVPAAARMRPLPGRPEADAAARPAEGGHFDELAFLSSVVDETATPAVPPPAAANPPSGGARFQPVARPAPPPAPSPSRNPFAQRAQDKIINNDGAAGPRIESKKVGSKGGLAANVSGNNPIVLRDKSGEASKTLKCGECGAVNYPTEWYCERCGAELASM